MAYPKVPYSDLQKNNASKKSASQNVELVGHMPNYFALLLTIKLLNAVVCSVAQRYTLTAFQLPSELVANVV